MSNLPKSLLSGQDLLVDAAENQLAATRRRQPPMRRRRRCRPLPAHREHVLVALPAGPPDDLATGDAREVSTGIGSRRPRLRPRARRTAARLVPGRRDHGCQKARTAASRPEGGAPVAPPEQEVTGGVHPHADARQKGRTHDYSGSPQDAPSGLKPWFRAGLRSCPEHTIVCGHWAALGLRLQDDLIALDNGCVWGGRLTAVRLNDRRIVHEPRSDH